MTTANNLVQGLLLGGLYAMFATGLSLMFGVMRLVNLAHGDFAILAAFLALVMVDGTGLHPLLTLGVAVPGMFVLGYLLQRGLLNFAVGGDGLAPVLVTFGLSIILQNLLLELFSADSRGLDAGAIEDTSLALGRLNIGWFPLLTLVTGAAVLGGLQLLLARTRLGRALRATSDDPEAAQLVGIDHRHAFAVATGLALATVAIAGIFLGIRTTFSPALGPTRLIFAFEAVIIGGLGSLWGTLAGGMVLGVAQTLGAQISPGWGVLTGHLVFLAVLAFRPSGLFGEAGGRMTTMATAGESPPDVEVERATTASRVGAGLALLAVVVFGTAPLWARTSVLRTLIGFFTLLALATMWNLLAGHAGLVSIGQQAYIGVGAYGLYWLSDSVGLDPFAAVPLAAVVAAVISVPVAVLAFRLRGGYFAIGTWVIAEALRLLVANTSQLGGGSGVTVTAVSGYDRQTRIYLTYWLAFTVGVGAVALTYLLLRRRLGLALTANRDSETSARSLGVDVYRVKLLVYVVAAFGCALAGAVIYLNLLRIQPDAAFSVNWSAFMIFIVVIGGVGTIEGPIVGAVLFFVVQETLAQYGAWYLILLGLIAVAIALRARHGLWGLLAERTGISLFPVRRRLRLPSPPTAGGSR